MQTSLQMQRTQAWGVCRPHVTGGQCPLPSQQCSTHFCMSPVRGWAGHSQSFHGLQATERPGDQVCDPVVVQESAERSHGRADSQICQRVGAAGNQLCNPPAETSTTQPRTERVLSDSQALHLGTWLLGRKGMRASDSAASPAGREGHHLQPFQLRQVPEGLGLQRLNLIEVQVSAGWEARRQN